MRYRVWTFVALVALLSVVAGCAAGGFGPAPIESPAPVKTLRPTFTHTPAVPTAVPPTNTPEAPPTATFSATPEVPPTETPEPATPTPEGATLRITSNTANVRSGPGTGFGRIGSVSQGQTYEVTGKNSAGDWYQFEYNDQTAWIYSQMVDITGAEQVEVAANVPALPTARPQPAAPKPAPQQPAPQQPAPQPAPSTYQFASAGASSRPNTNDYLTVRCRTTSDVTKTPSAGILVVNGPMSSEPKPFKALLETANTGMDKTMQYMTNVDCKVELRPFVPGSYTGILVDGGGKQISEPITFEPSGDMREFILIWNPR
jgi:hypothetical protein